MDTRFALLLACFFLSGFAALLYQTVWTRELALRLRHLGARGRGRARRLHGRARAGRRRGGALRRAAAPAGAGLRAARARRSRVCALLGARRASAAVDALYVGAVRRRSELPERRAPAAARSSSSRAPSPSCSPPTALHGRDAAAPRAPRRAHATARSARASACSTRSTRAGAIAGTLVRRLLADARARAAAHRLGRRGAERWRCSRSRRCSRAARRSRRDAATRGRTSRGGDAARSGSCRRSRVSGAVSFSYEVLWTRLLGHLLGGSLHAFATHAGELPARHRARQRRRGAPGAHAASARALRLRASRSSGSPCCRYAAFALADRLPALARRLGRGRRRRRSRSAALAAPALLPITLCIGATFPFAVRIAGARPPTQAAAGDRAGLRVEHVGAIAGALGAGFLLLPAPRLRGHARPLGVGDRASARWRSAALAWPAAPRGCRCSAPPRSARLLARVCRRATPWPLLRASPLDAAPARHGADRLLRGRALEPPCCVLDRAGRYRLVHERAARGVDRARGHAAAARCSSTGSARCPPGAARGARAARRRTRRRHGARGRAADARASIDVIELEPEVVAANR